MKNNCVRGISENGGIIFCAVDATKMINEMEQIHKTSAVVTAALGRLLIASGLMGVMLKSNDDSVTLRVDGDGPCGLLVAVSNGKGDTKGYVTNNVVEIELRQDGKLNVGSAVGKNGVISVVKDFGHKKPYIGQTQLISGEIGEDIAAYYAQSEQVPTVCGLGVLVNEDLTVKSAGGFMVQLLPGATQEEIECLEKNILAMQSVTQMLQQGITPEDMMHIALKGFNPNILDEQNIAYKCTCSKKRSEKILLSLGKQELEEMMKEDNEAEIACHFCNKKYKFILTELIKKY